MGKREKRGNYKHESLYPFRVTVINYSAPLHHGSQVRLLCNTHIPLSELHVLYNRPPFSWPIHKRIAEGIFQTHILPCMLQSSQATLKRQHQLDVLQDQNAQTQRSGDASILLRHFVRIVWLSVLNGCKPDLCS